MGLNPNNVAIGGNGNEHEFLFGNAGQTAIGGTANNNYSIAASNTAGSTIDGEGVTNSVVITGAGLVTVGWGDDDLHLETFRTFSSRKTRTTSW